MNEYLNSLGVFFFVTKFPLGLVLKSRSSGPPYFSNHSVSKYLILIPFKSALNEHFYPFSTLMSTLPNISEESCVFCWLVYSSTWGKCGNASRRVWAFSYKLWGSNVQMVTVISNTVLHTWNLLRVDRKHLLHTHTHRKIERKRGTLCGTMIMCVVLRDMKNKKFPSIC